MPERKKAPCRAGDSARCKAIRIMQNANQYELAPVYHGAKEKVKKEVRP